MSSGTTMGAARFERMTKEEKLRFCQDLIRQAVSFRKKPSGASDDRSTRSKTGANSVRSKSKSSKRPASAGSTTSKKTRSGASNRTGRSKSRDKLSTPGRTASKSPVCYRIFC
jgi:hypothetical protein